MTNQVVFDASALLALLKNEKGSDIAKGYIGKIIMSPINIAEVVYVLQRDGMANNLALEVVQSVISEISEVSIDDIKTAADIKNSSYKLGISTGDSFCLALGINKKLQIITADKIWLKLKYAKIICVR